MGFKKVESFKIVSAEEITLTCNDKHIKYIK